MNKIHSIILLLWVFWLCPTTVIKGQAALQNQADAPVGRLDLIQKTGRVRVGIREDAVPFGYREVDNQLRGFCLDFFALLQQTITEKTSRQYLSLHLYKSTLFDRFDLVENGTIDLECGPNTISRHSPHQVTFSEPFFMTGTQFLVRQADGLNMINPNRSLQDVAIGVLKGTTTEEYIKKTYPQANVQLFQGITGRVRGVQAIKQGKLDAFVSDGILLRGEAAIQQMSVVDYPLIPATPLTCDRYGMILPKDDEPWRELVNEAIARPEFKAIVKNWFEVVFAYVKSTKDLCTEL